MRPREGAQNTGSRYGPSASRAIAVWGGEIDWAAGGNCESPSTPTPREVLHALVCQSCTHWPEKCRMTQTCMLLDEQWDANARHRPY